MKVVNACEQSGRVCEHAKRVIGAEVLQIVQSCTILQVTDKGYFFDARLLKRLEEYFVTKEN